MPYIYASYAGKQNIPIALKLPVPKLTSSEEFPVSYVIKEVKCQDNHASFTYRT